MYKFFTFLIERYDYVCTGEVRNGNESRESLKEVPEFIRKFTHPRIDWALIVSRCNPTGRRSNPPE